MRNIIKTTLIIAVLTVLHIKIYVPLMSEDKTNTNRTEISSLVSNPSKEGYILAEASKKISFIASKQTGNGIISNQWIRL